MEIFKNNKMIIILSITIIIIFILIVLYEKQNEYENIEYEEIINNQEEIVETKESIKVHISGQTNYNGILELEEGSRIDDAINKAGGLTSEADITNINLAYELLDGQKIYIPKQNEEIKTELVTVGSGILTEDMNGNSNKININSATQTQLEELPGVGPSLALKIIKYREENGKFKNIEELKNVSGIGESKYEEMKEIVTVK